MCVQKRAYAVWPVHVHLFVIIVITFYFICISYQAPRSVSLYCAHTYARTRNSCDGFCLFGSKIFRFWMMATLHNRHMHVCSIRCRIRASNILTTSLAYELCVYRCERYYTPQTHTDSDMAFRSIKHWTSDRDGDKDYSWRTHTSVLLRTRSKSRWRFIHAQNISNTLNCVRVYCCMHECRSRQACIGLKYIIKHKCSWLNVKHGREEEQSL